MTLIVHISESGSLYRPHHTTGTPHAALASRSAGDREQALWREVESELHRWLRDGEELFDEAERPDPGVLGAALDFVVSHRNDVPAPVLVAPSGGGRLVMQWRAGETVQTIEFTDRFGREVTEFHRGRVVVSETMRSELAAPRESRSRRD